MSKRKDWIIAIAILVTIYFMPQQTVEEELNEIKEKNFMIVSKEKLEEGHKIFELKAKDLKNGEDIVFNNTFVYYSIFTSICGKPFIEVGDTLIKKKGELIFRVLKKNCICEMVLGKSERENVFVDWKKSHGCN